MDSLLLLLLFSVKQNLFILCPRSSGSSQVKQLRIPYVRSILSHTSPTQVKGVLFCVSLGKEGTRNYYYQSVRYRIKLYANASVCVCVCVFVCVYVCLCMCVCVDFFVCPMYCFVSRPLKCYTREVMTSVYKYSCKEKVCVIGIFYPITSTSHKTTSS